MLTMRDQSIRDDGVSTQGGGPLRFAGQLSKPASVTVAGVAATVDSRNRFEAKVNLSPGPQTIPVVATDPIDNSSVTHNYQVNVTAGMPRNYGRDNNGNITSSTSPDGSGAPSATYEWDAADRLIAINIGTHRSEIQYDGLGRRVHLTEKDAGNVTADRRFLWCGNELCEERDATGGVVMKRFLGQGEQRIGSSDAGVYFYTRDHLGSVRELVDSAGAVRARYDYGVWGQRTKLTGNLDTDLGFTGFYFHNQSGLSFSRTRAYDSALGKWINQDPIAENGGLNLYRYAANSPSMYVDPSGKNPALILLIIAIYFALDRYANAPTPDSPTYTGTAPNVLSVIDGVAAVPSLMRCTVRTGLSVTSRMLLREGDAVLAIIKDGKVLRTGNIGLSHEVFVERTVGVLPEGAQVVTIGKSGGEVYALTSRTYSGVQTYAPQAAQDAARATFR
jgi:RHS repeat-associated protein